MARIKKQEFICFKLNDAGTHYDRRQVKTVSAIITGGRCLHSYEPIDYIKGVPVFTHMYDFTAYMEAAGYVVEGMNT